MSDHDDNSDNNNNNNALERDRTAPSAALITGGSRGLGRALGEALAQTGVRVVLVAREAGPLQEVVAAIRRRGGDAHWIAADISRLESVAALAGEAAALVGPLDLLVNNASALGPVPLRLLLDTDCEDLTRVLETNLVGPFRLTKAVVGPMILSQRGGIVVNISSDASVEAYERWGPYGASKAAMDLLGRVWSAELAGTGVRVLSFDPGEMDTRMHADAVPGADVKTLADPARVAARILTLLAQTPPLPSGTRTAIQFCEES